MPGTFVDLLGDTRWSEVDVRARCEEELRGEFPACRESIMNRKVAGQLLGQYTMTAADLAELEAFRVCAMGKLARVNAALADAALLNATLDYEAAQAVVADANAAPGAQAAAQAVIDAAAAGVLALVGERAAARVVEAPPDA